MSGISFEIFRAKYRHYDYTYNARQNGLLGAVGGTGADVLSSRGGATAPQVAQKKHHLFGKRVFHDQSEMPGSPVVASPSHLHKYNYNASAAAGSVYSHPSTPLDNSSMHSMEMKYGCGMEYTHHPHGENPSKSSLVVLLSANRWRDTQQCQNIWMIVSYNY